MYDNLYDFSEWVLSEIENLEDFALSSTSLWNDDIKDAIVKLYREIIMTHKEMQLPELHFENMSNFNFRASNPNLRKSEDQIYQFLLNEINITKQVFLNLQEDIENEEQ